ncbi:MAG: hypothetical protein GY708_18795 [Actinomycetia bacterium]|nr:hypothetical protein [Actinomycetes bacterium]MCP4961767.1 hypothetical protein [Actinomycetes bacterium]
MKFSIGLLSGILTMGALAGTACGGSSESDSDPEPSTTLTTAEPPRSEPIVEGVPEVKVLGPVAGSTDPAPLFEWEPVPDAVNYQLVVGGPGGPIWGWQGTDTAVWLGGSSNEPHPAMSSPELVEGACWSVAGLDDDGHVVAVSHLFALLPGPAGHSCRP